MAQDAEVNYNPGNERFWVMPDSNGAWWVYDLHNYGWQKGPYKEKMAGDVVAPMNARHAQDMRSIREEAPEVKMQGPYDKELGIFLSLMRMKLEKYAYRGKWEGLGLQGVLDKLEAEVKELREAITKGDVTDILLESADCGNMALIAAMVAIRGDKK